MKMCVDKRRPIHYYIPLITIDLGSIVPSPHSLPLITIDQRSIVPPLRGYTLALHSTHLRVFLKPHPTLPHSLSRRLGYGWCTQPNPPTAGVGVVGGGGCVDVQPYRLEYT